MRSRFCGWFSFCVFFLLAGVAFPQSLIFSLHDSGTGSGPIKLVRSDFNNDSIMDLATVNQDSPTVTILLLNADGTFRSRQDFAAGQLPTGIAVGDFNHDHIVDLAVSNNDSDGTQSLALLLGNGNGTFQAPKFFRGGNSPLGIAAADFNADGNLDVVTGWLKPASSDPNAKQINQILINFGNGKGGFSGQLTISDVGDVEAPGEHDRRLSRIAVGDFNHDGRPDIVFIETGGGFDVEIGDVFVLMNNGGNNFISKKVVDSSVPVDVSTADVNQDGLDDILLTFSGCHTPCLGTTYLQSKGDGTFNELIMSQFSDSQYGAPTSPAAGDINGDGLKDILTAVFSFEQSRTHVAVNFQRADGTFRSPLFLASNAGGQVSTSMVAGDLNRDGRVDIAVSGDSNSVSTIMNITGVRGCRAQDKQRSVQVCLPLYSTVSSPVQVLANTRDTIPIEAIKVYVDGVSKFSTTDDLLSGRLNLPPGDHRMEVKAWDRFGSFAQTINFTIATGCVLSGIDRTVKICTPTNNGTVTSPVHIQASISDSGQVNAGQIYVDGVLKFSTGFTHLIDTSLAMASGSHRITVKAWDAAGQFSQILNVKVQ